MKKLLLIALIATGSTASAEPVESCKMTTVGVYTRVLGGADRETLKHTLGVEFAPVLTRTDTRNVDALLNMLLSDIYDDIGGKKLFNEPLDTGSMSKFLNERCKDWFLDYFQ